MKWVTKGVAASGLVAVSLWVGGCKQEPNPPTEQDAIGVWKNINKHSRLPSELVSFKKTNGQMATVNGVQVYTLYYTASEKNLVKVGMHPPGWIETWSSNYPFQWTEKGWEGPDSQIYPEH
jgi:hypothetical protein